MLVEGHEKVGYIWSNRLQCYDTISMLLIFFIADKKTTYDKGAKLIIMFI